MRKNVLQLVGSFNQGGSERQAVQLIKLLHADETHNVFVATLSLEGNLIEEIKAVGITDIPEFPLHSFYDLNFLKQVNRFRKYLKTKDIDLIQTHDFYSNVFGILVARLAGIRIKIAAKRETTGMRSPKQIKMEDRVFSAANKIVVNAKAVENYLLNRKVAENKIAVIYNGLDFSRLVPRNATKQELLNEFKLPFGEDEIVIAQVANMRHSVKNQDMVLRAAPRVIEKFPSSHFVFAGEGERIEILKDLAQDSGIIENVHFMGACRNVPDLLAISSIGLLTSFAEGFSNSILEYMYAELPVISTEVGGAAEVIENGTTGYLIESDDSSTLTEKLLQLLHNPEMSKSMGIAGKNYVINRFSLEKQLEETLRLYDEAG